MRRVFATALVLTAALSAVGVTASQADVGRSASSPTVASGLHCSQLKTGGVRPVLLIPGTSLSAETNYSWNYARAFSLRHIPFCMVDLPGHAMGDIQTAAESVLYAVREMHRISHQRISIVGYSQGGMIFRWVLKYWPDARSMVDDAIALDASNHGSMASPCLPGCAPAFWQQVAGSAFLRALNTGPETWPGISYTQIYTFTDELVVPDFGGAASSRLTTGAGRISNIPVQQICPLHVAEHWTMGTTDPVGFALVMDALQHVGPANPQRISRGVCTQVAMPGVDLTKLAANELRTLAEGLTSIATYPHVAREPRLMSYAR